MRHFLCTERFIVYLTRLRIDRWRLRSDFVPPNVELDSDHDGMPDEWERKHGLDPKNPADGSLDANADSYTNLEKYLNSLVKFKYDPN